MNRKNDASLLSLLTLSKFGLSEAMTVHDWLNHTGNYAQLVTLLHDADKIVVRNAAWALTKANEDELMSLLPHTDELFNLAIITNSNSIRRMILNVIERLPLTEECLRTDFLDFCLDHMADSGTPPAIQALCMKIGYRLCAFYPELADEFMRIVTSLDLSLYTPALKCTVRNILKKNKMH